MIDVVDEAGAPIESAVFVTQGDVYRPGSRGDISFRVDQPVSGVVSADGYIDEPLVISRTTPHVAVRLFAEFAADGTPRTVLHFGGDVMLGRRYLDPEREGTAVLGRDTIEADARDVVSDIAPMFAAADVSSVNLESVVGRLPDEVAYPRKRFLLQTPPEALSALDELGVDVVTLGNNHVNDWQDLGVASTLRHLEEAGVPAVGAGADDAQARRPVVVEGHGLDVGMLSYTTVNGDFVNDNMPVSTDLPPDPIPQADAWLYEARSFTWQSDGGYEVAGEMLPGDAWAAWRVAVRSLRAADERRLWAALSAAFPELQDWVARRGHGGAALFGRDEVAEDVASLRERADIVVVQIHGGFQFSTMGSLWLQEAARASIDAGADIVIGHHPHVLQGFEWYRGKLIVYSLGNLVFDQDFLATYASAMLRTVFEGDRLIEAKVYPLSLEGYRPVPAADRLATSILKTIDVRSAVPAIAVRRDDGSVAGIVVDPATRDGARLTIVGNVGYVRRTATSLRSIVVDLPALGSVPLPTDALVRPTEDLDGVWLGRDLLGRGSFDDVHADGVIAAGMDWTWGESGRLVSRDEGFALELGTRPGNTRNVIARPVARITRSDHWLYDADGEPVDGDPFYTVRLDVRRTTDVSPELRITTYHFDDSNPVIDPINDVIRTVVVPVDSPGDGSWHTIEVKVPVETFVPDGSREANAAFLYLQVPPGRGVVGFDNIQFLEFRPAAELPPTLLQNVDVVRSTDGAQTVVLSLS